MAVSLSFTRVGAKTDSPGTPLVLAHGLLGQGRNFGTLARGFAEHRDVISVDMRNHGDSPWDARMDYRAMAEDLGALIDAEAGGRAHLLGHSMGGKAAMITALTHQDLLASLIVADIAPVAYDHHYRKQISAMQQIGLPSIRNRKQADEILQQQIPERSMRAFLLQNLDMGGDGPSWKPNLDVIDASMDNIIGWPDLRAGTDFRGPVLFVKGADSDYVLDSHRERIEALFPKVRFESLAGAGHWLHAERPKPFFEAVQGFLATLDE